MLDFIFKLPFRYFNPDRPLIEVNLVPVEIISQLSNFLVYTNQVIVDGSNRLFRISEPLQLWVLLIVFCIAFQHIFCKQGFAPKIYLPLQPD